MKRAEETSAIRILPPDDNFVGSGDEFVAPPSPRWRIPGVVAGVVLAVFLFSTRPSGTADNSDTLSLAPPISAIAIETVDLVRPPLTIDEWTPAPLDPGAQIHSILRHSSILAIGSSEGNAQAWVSGNGSTWRPSIDIETSVRPADNVDHAVYWDGAVIALSIEGDTAGVWRSRTVGSWQYQGDITGLRSQSLTGLAGGEQLLALETFDGGVQGWTSADGQDWANLGMLNTLSDISINALEATDQFYFAGGRSHPDLVAGKPAVHRSPDGVMWEPVDGDGLGILSTATGEVTAMTTHAGAVYATGWTIEDDGVVIATWKSDDGVLWERLGTDAPAFRPSTITLQAPLADSADAARATIILNGSRHLVAAGFALVTNDGTFHIDDIQPHLVEVRVGDEDVFLHRGQAATELTLSGRTNSIAVQGPRIVVAGSIEVGGLTTPALWVSTDRGISWERSTVPDTVGELTGVVTAGPNIAVLGATAGESAMWRTTWDTQRAADHAGAIATRYVAALNARDLSALTGLLPDTNETMTSPKFDVPSLGAYPQSWWDPDTGLVDVDRVNDTLEYLAATDAQIELGECTTGAALANVDRATATCEFSTSSTTLATLGYEGEGRLRAAFTNGVFDGVFLDLAPANPMWEALTAGIGNAPPADQQTLIVTNEGGYQAIAPVFDAAAAAVHSRLAVQLAAGLLTPGDVRVVETALGTMEWRWVNAESLPGGLISSVAWNDSGFLAMVFEEFTSTLDGLSTWQSPDGLSWTEVVAPQGIEGITELHAFGDGWIARAWKQEQSLLVFFDGTAWTEIELFEEGEAGPLNLAVGGDRLLAIGGTWSEDQGSMINHAWMVGPDLVPRPVTTPEDYDWASPIGVAGNEDGFLLGMAGLEGRAELKVWHTEDGMSWTILTDSTPIDDSLFIFDIQEHRSRYFVVGQSVEQRCTVSADVSQCSSQLGLWSSPDGIAWDRLVTRTGEPVPGYAIASGDLGLFAFSRPDRFEDTTPQIVHMSIDGGTWQQLGDLSIALPTAEWWSLLEPAVSPDTVLVPGVSATLSDDDPDEVGFLIVGRLLDP